VHLTASRNYFISLLESFRRCKDRLANICMFLLLWCGWFHCLGETDRTLLVLDDVVTSRSFREKLCDNILIFASPGVISDSAFPAPRNCFRRILRCCSCADKCMLGVWLSPNQVIGLKLSHENPFSVSLHQSISFPVPLCLLSDLTLSISLCLPVKIGEFVSSECVDEHHSFFVSSLHFVSGILLGEICHQ
jgi:hypothetical protein